MTLIVTITSIINTIILLGIVIKYLKDNYTICTIEQWNTVVKFYNKHYSEYDENDNPLPEEKSGGVGFQVFNDEEEYTDEEQ